MHSTIPGRRRFGESTSSLCWIEHRSWFASSSLVDQIEWLRTEVMYQRRFFEQIALRRSVQMQLVRAVREKSSGGSVPSVR